MIYTALLVGGENSGLKIEMTSLMSEIEVVAGSSDDGFFTEIYVRQPTVSELQEGSVVIFKVRE